MSPRSLLAVTTLALCVVGCGDPAPAEDPQDRQIADLVRAVEGLNASNEELAKEVRRQGRELADLSGGRSSRLRPAVEVTSAAAAGDDGAEGASDALATPGAMSRSQVGEEAMNPEIVDAVLQSETGQKAIQEATSREIERREAKDRRLFVSYEVGRFAQRAGLDERQSKELQQIWKTSMDGGVELRKQFAAIGALPEAERQAARAAAMETMRDLGRQRRESVRELLNDEQFELYEPAEEKIVAGLHGAPRR